MGVGSREQGGVPPWIFIRGTNIVDKGLKVLFSAFFCYFSVFFSVAPLPPWKRLNSVIFRYFLTIFGIFSLPSPLENFLPTPLYPAPQGKKFLRPNQQKLQSLK